MLFPYNTDAPVYHFPSGTIGIIVVNVIAYFSTVAQIGSIEDFEKIEWLLLHFDTINPIQWVTNVFMHASFGHLFGNMVFLWAFGLVVEGKLGLGRFLLLYLILALLDGFVVQIPMYLISGEGMALGASGVIFALMAIAVVWAPENEMSCLLILGIFIKTIEIRLIMMGVLYLAIQLFFAWWSGFGMSSEMLHLAGIAVGFPIGLIMLKRQMVDCEGWDIISRYAS